MMGGREREGEGGMEMGHWPAAVSAQNNTQRGPCHCDIGIAGIVMRRNVLFDRWMILFYVMEII